MKSTRIFTTCAMLTALYVVLGMCASLNLGNMKITLDALPIIIAALYLGPIEGMIVGLTGSFFLQLLQYGLSPTTLLWILPAGTRGLLVGVFQYEIKKYPEMLKWVIVGSSLCITALNTVIMAIDSIIYGYYSHAYVFGALLWRISAGIVSSIIYAVIIPRILKRMRINDIWKGYR